MRKRYFGKARRSEIPRTVHLSNLQLRILHEMREKKVTSLDEVGEFVQVSVGSLRYRGYIEYVKKCSHGGYCECEGQGYQLTKLGAAVDDKFFGNATNVYRNNADRPLSMWLQEDAE